MRFYGNVVLYVNVVFWVSVKVRYGKEGCYVIESVWLVFGVFGIKYVIWVV